VLQLPLLKSFYLLTQFTKTLIQSCFKMLLPKLPWAVKLLLEAGLATDCD